MNQMSRLSVCKLLLTRIPFERSSVKHGNVPISLARTTPVYHQQQNRFSSEGGDLVTNLEIWAQRICDKGDEDEVTKLSNDLSARRRWHSVNELYETWIQKNIPNLQMCNDYFKSRVETRADDELMLQIMREMESFKIQFNTVSYNLILKSMLNRQKSTHTEQLVQRMKQSKESQLDGESYKLVSGIFFKDNKIDDALLYTYLTLHSGFRISLPVFTEYVLQCVRLQRYDALISILQKYKSVDKENFRCLPWNMCTFILNASLEEENRKLTLCALELLKMHKLNCEESVGDKKIPSIESYLVKIYAYSFSKDVHKAFATLKELESAHGGDLNAEKAQNLFSPFISLYPLALACYEGGINTLDSVYHLLKDLSVAEPSYKSVAALNCVILGCSYRCADRAHRTFNAITDVFGLTPDINSYDALRCASHALKRSSEKPKPAIYLSLPESLRPLPESLRPQPENAAAPS